MKKRGMVFNLILVIFAIACLIALYASFKILQSKTGNVGERQNQIIRSYMQAERDLFYIDKAAEYSVHSSLKKLNDKGGHITTECDEYSGYSLWQSEEESCFPDKNEISDELKNIIDDELKRYFLTYEFYKLPPDNYDYFIHDYNNITEFIGIALKNLEYSDNFLEYSIKPSFNIYLNYSPFSHYAYITNSIRKEDGLISSVTKCQEELKKCIEETIEKLNSTSYKWVLDCDHSTDSAENEQQRTYAFCVYSKEHYLYSFDDKGYVSVENPVIKFALYLADLAPAPIEEIEHISPMGEDRFSIVKWKKSPEPDIENYTIYYSTTDMTDAKIENHTIQNAMSIDINVKDIINADSFNVECQYMSVYGKCMHDISSGDIEKTSISLEELNNELLCTQEYCYYVTDTDLKSYIYVTAIDTGSNEIKKVLVAEEVEIQDKLSPGLVDFSLIQNPDSSIDVKINSVQDNVDGSPFSNDLIKYYIFTSENSDSIVQFKNLQAETAAGSYNLIGIDPSFYIGIIAVDSSDNPFTETRISAAESSLDINPEYMGIIHTLSNAKKP